MRSLIFEPTGGFWPYTHELAAALGSSIQVSLLTSRKHSGIYPYEMNAIARPMAENLKPGNPIANLTWAADRLSCSLSWLQARARLAREVKPDLVHLQSTVPVLDQYILPAFAKKYPVLYTVHDVLPFTASRAFGSHKALQKVYTAAQHLVVHSERNKMELIASFGIPEEKVSVIPHGTKYLEEKLDKAIAKKKLSLPQAQKMILVFGGIRESKGLDLAVEAFAEVIRFFPKTLLLVAGKPSYDVDMDYFYRLAEKNGVNSQINWQLEYIPEGEVGTFFSASDLVLLPYKKFHAQSGVLLQAYKYSVPVVVTDLGALGETVRCDRTGLVATDATPDKLAECMVTLLSSEELQAEFSQNMLKAINEKYDWSIVAERTMALYCQLLNRRKQARGLLP